MIKFYTYKKHQKNTRHQKYQKTVLNFLFIFFFHGKILHAEKAQKEFTAPKSTKSTKIQPSKSKKRK